MTKSKLLKRIKSLENDVNDYIKVHGDLKCYKDEKAKNRNPYYLTSFWSGQLLHERFEELYTYLGVERKQETAKTYLLNETKSCMPRDKANAGVWRKL